MSDIADRVKNIVVEHLGVDADKVVGGASFIDDLGADSLTAVEIVMELEKKLDISIDDSEVDKIVTIQDIINIVEAKK